MIQVHDARLPGGFLEVDTDDPAKASAAAKKYLAGTASAPAAPAQQQPSTMGDVAKSVVSGLGKGVAAVAGLPGDVSDLLDKGANYLTGAKVSTRGPLSPPNSQQVGNVISAPTGGFHEPKTTAGKYAETIASFAPAAVAPGGAVARIARVAVPGAASETAGQLTKGTEAEPYARVIGALAGGAATGLGELSASAARPTPGVPTVAELKTAAYGEYGAADNAGVIISKDSFGRFVSDLKSKLADEGIDETLHPKAVAVLKRLDGVGDNITLKGVDILRRVARGAAGSIDKDERRIGRQIVDGIDDYIGNLSPKDVLTGDAEGAAQSLTSARDLWTRASKGEMLDGAIEKARTRSSQFSGSGFENALRTEFRKIAMNDRAMRRFGPQEQDAIKKVAVGGPLENSLRFLGKFSPHGLLGTLMTGGAGFAAGGPAGAAAALATGEAARVGATALTTRNARLASELVRKGKPRSISQASTGSAAVPEVSYAERIRQNATAPSE